MASRSKVTDAQLQRTFDSIEVDLISAHSDTFRRIWVSYTRIGKVRVDVMLTLFPHVGDYRMVFLRGLDVSNISLDSIMGLIDG